MKNKVAVGILGCADVAKRYAIPAFQSIENARVVSIASRKYAKARSWARLFGIDATKSYDDLLANPDIEAVYIPLPIGIHEEWIIKAANAGKHVICEKSLTTDYASTKRAVDACKANDVVLFENYTCRYHPQHATVKKALKDGVIGTPLVFQSFFGFPSFTRNNIRYNVALEASSLSDAGGYPVLMSRRIFESEPLAATCTLTYSRDGIDIRGSALLEFSGGKTASFTFSYDCAYQNNYTIWGERGIISVDRAYSIAPQTRPQITLTRNDGKKDVRSRIYAPSANQFELIFKVFCSAVLYPKKHKRVIEDSYSEILAQARAMELLRRSATEHRRVEFKEIL